MSQKSEDSVEKFFRKAVVQQDTTFLERDWDNLERMLDERDMALAMARASRLNKVSKIAALLMVVSITFVVMLDNPELKESVQTAEAALPPQSKLEAETVSADQNNSSVAVQTPSILNATARSQTSPNKKLADRSADNKKGTMDRTFPPFSSLRHTEEKVGRPVSTDHDTNIKREPLIATMSPKEFFVNPPSASFEDAGIVQIEDLPGKPNTRSFSETDMKFDSMTTASEVELAKVNDQATRAANDHYPSQFNFSKLQITGFVSPDFSSTQLAKYSRPSTVVGLVLGYRLTRRLTVMSGVSKALKKYEGYGKEYSPPEGYWEKRTNGVVPDEVYGKCGIIEVPLLVQYDVVQRSSSRIFVSAGLSSYFMRSESYRYAFNAPNPGAADSWTAKEPTHYLFKIGHLSAGYDHSVGNRWAIGIEPFIKVPFEGIGWTDIRLYSTGALLNVRYTLVPSHR